MARFAASRLRVRDLGAALDKVCEDPKRLAAMREATHKIRRPYSAAAAGHEVLTLMGESERWSSQ